MPKKIIAVANQKGGVGKTTTTISLAHSMAMEGKRVLIVDLDSQGHIAPGFRQEKGNGLQRLIVEEQPIDNVVLTVRHNLDIVTNDHTCELVKEHVKQLNFREYLLANILGDITGYDLIFLDTPPSTDVLHILALVASDYVILPTTPDYYALDGVAYILKTLRTLARYPEVEPPVLIGALPTLFDRVTNETMTNIISLQSMVGEYQVLPPIPRDTKIREASSHGQTIWEYAPDAPAAIGIKTTSSVRNSRGFSGGYLHITEILRDLI